LRKACAPVTEQEQRELHKTADLLADIRRQEVRMDQAKVVMETTEIRPEGRCKVERRVEDVENDTGETKIRICNQIGSNKEEWYSQGVSKQIRGN
jgi:hypothetical protein